MHNTFKGIVIDTGFISFSIKNFHLENLLFIRMHALPYNINTTTCGLAFIYQSPKFQARDFQFF